MAIMAEAMLDAFMHGTGIIKFAGDEIIHIPVQDFFRLPAKGERDPWGGVFYWAGSDDDGGNAALAFYRFAMCKNDRHTKEADQRTPGSGQHPPQG